MAVFWLFIRRHAMQLMRLFFGPTTFHQGLQLFEVVGPDVQQLFLAKPLTLVVTRCGCKMSTLAASRMSDKHCTNWRTVRASVSLCVFEEYLKIELDAMS